MKLRLSIPLPASWAIPSFLFVLFLFALWLPPSHVQAADVYRWMDERGGTHFGDAVPPQFRKSAVKVHEGAGGGETGGKAAAGRAKEAATHPVAQTVPQPPAPSAVPVPDSPGDKKIVTLEAPSKPPRPADPNDCNALRAEYERSQVCFAPYRNVNGSVRAEAFQVCREVPDPSVKCGAPSN